MNPSHQFLSLSSNRSYPRLNVGDFKDDRIYYCIHKDSVNQTLGRIFQLVLFKLQRKEGYEQFVELYRKQLRKKEINEASLTFVCRHICQWALLGKMADRINEITHESQEDQNNHDQRLRKSNRGA